MTGEQRRENRLPSRRQINILMVEDNPGDMELAQEALKGTGRNCQLHFAEDGVEAISFLRKINGYKESPRPDIVLLDLNLPCKGGFEVLAEIKGDRGLKSIPVIVFTTSQNHNDISQSYALQANSYIVKPITLKDYRAVMMAIEQFWSGIAILPS